MANKKKHISKLPEQVQEYLAFLLNETLQNVDRKFGIGNTKDKNRILLNLERLVENVYAKTQSNRNFDFLKEENNVVLFVLLHTLKKIPDFNWQVQDNKGNTIFHYLLQRKEQSIISLASKFIVEQHIDLCIKNHENLTLKECLEEVQATNKIVFQLKKLTNSPSVNVYPHFKP